MVILFGYPFWLSSLDSDFAVLFDYPILVIFLVTNLGILFGYPLGYSFGHLVDDYWVIFILPIWLSFLINWFEFPFWLSFSFCQHAPDDLHHFFPADRQRAVGSGSRLRPAAPGRYRFAR